MIKAVELIIALVLLIFAFLAGVKYSDSVKSHASWIFESKDLIEMQDLDIENTEETIEQNIDYPTNSPAPDFGPEENSEENLEEEEILVN